MRLLLDTHAFLWWIMDDPRLSAVARAAISSSITQVLLSVVSMWEIALKVANGKLRFGTDPRQFLPEMLVVNRIELLPLSLDHILATLDLPANHKDPFDRLLIAQALVEGVPLVTSDRLIQSYPIQIFW